MYEKITEIIKQEKKFAICIIVNTKGSTPRKIGSKMLVLEDKTIYGSIGGGELEKTIIEKALIVIKTQQPQLIINKLEADHHMACGGEMDIYIEPIIHRQKLYIFGAGHIGKILAEFSSKFNFQITVIDNRKGIFDDWNKEQFNLINKNYEDIFETLKFDAQTFICCVTYAHTFDKEVIAYCGKQQFAYLGMLSSKRKVAKFKTEFIKNNILTPEEIDKIDMPMGVPITCETPEEIAISILAKLIDVKNKTVS